MSDDGSQDPRRLARKYAKRWTAKREEIFFRELAETANVAHAARHAGVTDKAVHHRRQRYPAFAARWMAALEEGYARLELLLLDQSLNGYARTETVADADGTVKQVKTVRSFPHGIALRLFQQHGATVLRYRAMTAGQDAGDDDAVAEKLRTELARVRARLAERGGADG